MKDLNINNDVFNFFACMDEDRIDTIYICISDETTCNGFNLSIEQAEKLSNWLTEAIAYRKMNPWGSN